MWFFSSHGLTGKRIWDLNINTLTFNWQAKPLWWQMKYEHFPNRFAAHTHCFHLCLFHFILRLMPYMYAAQSKPQHFNNIDIYGTYKWFWLVCHTVWNWARSVILLLVVMMVMVMVCMRSLPIVWNIHTNVVITFNSCHHEPGIFYAKINELFDNCFPFCTRAGFILLCASDFLPSHYLSNEWEGFYFIFFSFTLW